MNVQGLIGEVAKRHNVLLDAHDPVFVAVTLNELLLEESLRRLNAAAEEGGRRAKQAAGELVSRSGTYVADQVRAAAAEAGSEIEQRIARAAASLRAHEKAGERHRHLAFVFMMVSALASALWFSCVVRGAVDGSRAQFLSREDDVALGSRTPPSRSSPHVREGSSDAPVVERDAARGEFVPKRRGGAR